MQTLASLQAPLVGTKTQPVAASQLSAVHGLLSVQFCCGPGTQDPPAQPSPTVQALLSSQVPSLATNEHPVAPKQASTVHGLPSTHVRAAPGTQMPCWQVSLTVQLSPSLHVPAHGVKLQPLAAVHPSSVQGKPSLHVLGLPPLHEPLAQVSPSVQALASSQLPEMATCEHPLPALQVSVEHGLPSSQLIAEPLLHVPEAQRSPLVHTLPSLQALPVCAACAQPLVGLQVSRVQANPSSQSCAPPPVHWPLLQTSATVHASPSSHAATVIL